MKKLITNIQFANEAANPTLFGFVNEITIGEDGWAMIAPLGDFPSEALLPTASGGLKRQKAIQRITKESAAEMVAQFHNSRAGLKKFIRGCNIYVGHPDMPGLESRYPDKEPKGVFADMEVRDNGIYGLPVFTNAGMNLVEGKTLVNGKKVRGFSGRLVDSVPDGNKDGVPVFRPTQIVSAGLTPYPHLPVEFFNADDTLATEAVNQPTNQNMKKKLLAICSLLGIQFANESDDAATEAALDQVNSRVAAFANEQTSIRKTLLAICGKVGITFANEAAITDPAATLAQVEGKLAGLTTERDSLRTQFANERTARINDELTFAVTSGRITEAERAQWESRLRVDAQFVNERTALHNLTPKVKTNSITLERGNRKDSVDLNNPQQRQQFVNEVLAEIAAEHKLNPVKDSKHIQNLARSRHPALFEAKHVEIKLPGGKK